METRPCGSSWLPRYTLTLCCQKAHFAKPYSSPSGPAADLRAWRLHCPEEVFDDPLIAVLFKSLASALIFTKVWRKYKALGELLSIQIVLFWPSTNSVLLLTCNADDWINDRSYEDVIVEPLEASISTSINGFALTIYFNCAVGNS